LSEAGALTPTWYARVFNGYGLSPTRHDNVVETMRSQRAQVRLLVGTVTPWLTAIDGDMRSSSDQPWLHFFNTVLTHIATSAQAKSSLGIPSAAPDGFALHASGHLEDSAVTQPGSGKAHAGFRVYKDWLATINEQPTLRGLPAYITATNTYVPGERDLPAQNYGPGWLTSALDEILAEPQVHALCWFVDEALGGRWTEFSLQDPVGRMHDAAEEFDQLLQQR
jgi:hypothetical protein